MTLSNLLKQSETFTLRGIYHCLPKTLLVLTAIMALMVGCKESTSMELPREKENKIDEPEGFSIEVLSPHGPFSDEVSVEILLNFKGNGGEPIERNLDDASTVIFAEVNWEPGGSSGWHRHPGLAIVTIVEGEVESTWKRDCTPRTYAAGESFLDYGDIHIAKNLSDTEGARAYVTFLGVPDGEPATIWVEPVECP